MPAYKDEKKGTYYVFKQENITEKNDSAFSSCGSRQREKFFNLAQNFVERARFD